MQLSPGARVHSFEVLGPLGAGGMGAVYRARDAKLGRDVAIKILQHDLSSNREYLHRFEREARAASALNHPNIITIFEINEFEGAPFIAMELVEGASLRDLLKKGPVPIRKLLDIATQTADGLASAHERGIVHRDLKPENVMLTNDGRVKILDFGLARINEPATSGDATSEFSAVRTPAGRILGTASYVSPEQAGGGRLVDFRSDQFSFGSLLYELATGRRAFERNSVVETLAAIMRDEPEPPQRRNPRLPPPLCWIIERCLSKDPSDRYASTSDLARELRTLRDRLPETSPGRLPRPAMWSLRARALGIASVVIAAIVAVISVSHRFGSNVDRLPNQKYLAVLPFTDLSGRPDGALFSQGFGEAVSARLSRFSGMQVIPPAASAALVAKKSDFKRVAQELGATLLLNASVQRSGDVLRVSYSLIEPDRGSDLAGDVINGSVHNIWAAQDEVADAVARDLGIEQRRPPTQHTGLETAEEQDSYVRALGGLDRRDDEPAIDSAIALLDQLLETAPSSSLVLAALGRAYIAKYTLTRDKQWSTRAINACARATQFDPNSADVLTTIGDVQRYTGHYPEAAQAYKRSLALHPDAPDATLGLAKSYQGAGNVAAAEATYGRAIALRPTWWVTHNELGFLYLKGNRFAKASAEFSQVARLNPRSPVGYRNAGVVYARQGNLQAAADAFRSAIAFGEDANAYANLGYCYYFLGRYDEAAAAYQAAVRLRPSRAAYWSNLGDTCAYATRCRDTVHDSYIRAIELLRNDLTVNANSSDAHATLAVCLAKTNATAEARREIRTALQLAPTDSSVMYRAARVSNLIGEKNEAFTFLQRAMAAGYPSFEAMTDPEFAALRTHPDFPGLGRGLTAERT